MTGIIQMKPKKGFFNLENNPNTIYIGFTILQSVARITSKY